MERHWGPHLLSEILETRYVLNSNFFTFKNGNPGSEYYTAPQLCLDQHPQSNRTTFLPENIWILIRWNENHKEPAVNLGRVLLPWFITNLDFQHSEDFRIVCKGLWACTGFTLYPTTSVSSDSRTFKLSEQLH